MIAPGYYECTEQVVVGVIEGETPVSSGCGRRYQEGGSSRSDAALCACRTVAIRYCARCSTPLCGDHGSFFDSAWHCSSCISAIKVERAETARSHKKTRLEEYRELPEIGEADLSAWIRGETPADAFRDGFTHQASSWTGEKVATLLATLLNEPEYNYIVRGSDYSSRGGHRWIGSPTPKDPPPRGTPDPNNLPRPQSDGDIVLRPSGEVVRLRASTSAADSYSHYGEAYSHYGEKRAAATARFNSARLGDSDLDPNGEAFHWVRRTFQFNVRNVALLREQRALKERARRAESRRDIAVLVFVLLVVAGIVALIVSSL